MKLLFASLQKAVFLFFTHKILQKLFSFLLKSAIMILHNSIYKGAIDMETALIKSIPRADYPEQVGVSSVDIAEFIKDLKDSGIEAHSIMIIRDGKVAYETWRKPYSPDMPHAMYSVSKSMTSIAAGYAIDEGFFSLETKLLDVFPEYRTADYDEKLEKITVRHLLNMTAGKDVSLLADKSKGDWPKQFLDSKWYADPDDEEWRYISECSYMVCAVIKRTTGMSVSAFLTPRLYEPLSFGRVPFWEVDENGVEAGGWGIYMKTEELAKIALCVFQNGMFEGKQVMPAAWLEQATRKQSNPERYSEIDNRAGYGYFFWLNGVVPNSFRLDGMFSQFAVCFRDYNAIVVMTSCEIEEQKSRDCLWRHFPAAFLPEPKSDKDYLKMKDKLVLETLEELHAMPHSLLEKTIAGREITFKKPTLLNTFNFPVSMLPLASVYMSADRAGNIDHVSFQFEEDVCYMTWTEGEVTNTITCGMDGEPRHCPIHLAGIDFTARCSAAWENENTLAIWFRPMESVCQRRWQFVFDADGSVQAIPGSNPHIRTMVKYLCDSMDDFIDSKTVSSAVKTAAMKMYSVVEPIHKGRFVDTEVKE